MKNSVPADEEPGGGGGGGEISRRIELAVSLGESLGSAAAVLGREGLAYGSARKKCKTVTDISWVGFIPTTRNNHS